MSVKTITKQNFDHEVMNAEKPVLLDFWAVWCGPCKRLSPVIDRLAREREDIEVGKIDIDSEMELARRFGVMSIPTLVVIKDGKILAHRTGILSKEKLQAMLAV